MKFPVKTVVVLALIAVAAVVGRQPVQKFFKERNKPEYRTVKVARRSLELSVDCTGKVEPVLSVTVGAFVSGPITRLHVKHNDRVTKDQLLAEIDPRIYDAAVARDKATLATRLAEVKRAQAQLQQAVNDEKRSIALRNESADFISQAELDQFHFTRMSMEAQLQVAKAAVEQAQATLNTSEANVGYTKIRSPVDGIVIDRKIDPGQTLATQFQTPELFIIAPQMEKKMHIFATVDEADLGLIRRAQKEEQPVELTVYAYPEDRFQGTIEQIRLSPTEDQTVVTYPVVVSAPNPELKLLPGMTADLEFIIEKKLDVLCVPNTALRFYPPEKTYVVEEDWDILDGEELDERDQEVDDEENETASADRTESVTRHVWVANSEGRMKAIPIKMGISDDGYTEVLEGELTEGQELIKAIK